ncbi:MAG: vitamin K epoxide reductase family protein [Candidatus Pacebacteria bacterium]|nr:vitamin K epoxide reductase family protein [Candidatus Paceibacterota bacterium]
MTSFALLFTLASIGISETVYLIRKRIASEKPICPIGNDCSVVLSSKYSKFFLVPNDVLGLMAYIIMAVVTAFLVIGVPGETIWFLILKVFVTIASVMSAIFTYLQWKVIKAWCFWCLMSAFTIWMMAIILIVSSII